MRPTALAVLLCAALLAGVALANDAPQPDAAFLVVRKSASPHTEGRTVVGRGVEVAVEVYNAGAKPATSIEITDVVPPTDLFDVAGETSLKLERLAAGATARLAYTLTPKVPLSGRLDPATVSYADGASRSVTRTAQSTRAGIAALSPLQEAARLGMKAGSILTLGALRTPEQYRTAGLVSAVAGGAAAVWAAVGGARAAAASRRRAKALREVEKMK